MPLPQITVIGNLTGDAQLRMTNSGKAVAKLRVASNERKKTETGEWVDADVCGRGKRSGPSVYCWGRCGVVERLVSAYSHASDMVSVYFVCCALVAGLGGVVALAERADDDHPVALEEVAGYIFSVAPDCDVGKADIGVDPF